MWNIYVNMDVNDKDIIHLDVNFELCISFCIKYEPSEFLCGFSVFSIFFFICKSCRKGKYNFNNVFSISFVFLILVKAEWKLNMRWMFVFSSFCNSFLDVNACSIELSIASCCYFHNSKFLSFVWGGTITCSLLTSFVLLLHFLLAILMTLIKWISYKKLIL